MHKISVIIPNYNHSTYLKNRIDSVLNQTYQDIEVIILDDCSKDDSKDVIQEYKNHKKVSHIIYNEINSGSPFIQWQKGFALAKGEFIWIAESDDYAEVNFLEKLLPLFDHNKNVGVVYTDSNIVDANNIIHSDYYKKFRNNTFKTKKWNNDYIKSGIEEIKENLFFECTINNTSAMVFKKDLLKNVDFDYLKKFKYCGDWFFFISLLNNCSIAYKKEALNYFKYGTDNFAKGTKSTLNYFKERFMVRYYFWNQLKSIFTTSERKKLYSELGIEMRIQLNEVIKGNSNLNGTFKSFALLKKINQHLFYKQFTYALKAYIWKN
ncbi:MAG: glycosyltransferase family 2 protein [Janthinobacterium lividum]